MVAEPELARSVLRAKLTLAHQIIPSFPRSSS